MHIVEHAYVYVHTQTCIFISFYLISGIIEFVYIYIYIYIEII